MTEETMPAVEEQEVADGQEAAHYECSFHILPTIADEEVSHVVDGLKELITRDGGTITGEEAPERYDLAYDIHTKIDGENRRFNASHLGWVRFTTMPAAISRLTEELMHKPDIFRYLIVRLSRDEAEQPFSVFAARRDDEIARKEKAAQAAEARGEAPAEVEEEVDDTVTT